MVDAAVGAVGVGDDAGSRTSWSIAGVCSAMPELRHQEGKHELGRSDGNSLSVGRFLDPAGAGARRFFRRLLAMHGVTPSSECENGDRPGSLGSRLEEPESQRRLITSVHSGCRRGS